METHRAKRIEIMIETPALRRVRRALENAGVRGYSILSVEGGYGRTGSWSSEGEVSIASDMDMIWCIVAEERAEAVVDAVFSVVDRQIGVVTISDCEVVRRERF